MRTFALCSLLLTIMLQGNIALAQDEFKPTTSWKWWQGQIKMYFRSNPLGATQPAFRDNPFIQAGSRLQDSPDYHPSDGWMLAYYNFGSSASPKDFPFFAIYNKYKATLRFMFYNGSREAYQYFRVGMRIYSSGTRPAVFALQDPNGTKAKYNPDHIEYVLSKANKNDGWICVDFPLHGYHPSVMNTSTKMNVTIEGIAESELNLSGKIELKQVLDEQANVSVGGGFQALKNNFMSALKKGKTTYKNFNEYKSKASKVAKDLGKTDSGPYKFLKNVFKMSTEGIAAKKSFLEKIVKSKFAEAIPFVGGFISAFKVFTGSSSEHSLPMPLHFNGTIELKGTITQVQSLESFSFFFLPGSNTSLSQFSPVQTIPWGLMLYHYAVARQSVLDYIRGYDINGYPEGWREYYYDSGNLRFDVNPSSDFSVHIEVAFEYSGRAHDIRRYGLGTRLTEFSYWNRARRHLKTEGDPWGTYPKLKGYKVKYTITPRSPLLNLKKEADSYNFV